MADNDAIRGEAATLHVKNEATVKRLARDGIVVTDMDNLKVISFLEFLLGDDLAAAHCYHELQLAHELESVEKEARKTLARRRLGIPPTGFNPGAN